MVLLENSITVTEEIILILYKLFAESRRGRNTSQLILCGHHYRDSKADKKYYKKKKLQASIPPEHRHKILNKVLAN